jgi:hypothetical protein
VEEPDSEDTDVLKSFDTALWLLSARRQGIDEPPIDNQWLWGEIRQLRDNEGDPGKYLESIGNLLGALIEVSSFFLTGWAHSSGEDAEAIIAMTRRICEDNYSTDTPTPSSSPQDLA